jgi:hypothetical protein
VYLAFDNDTGREVAWNVISFAHLSRSERKRIDAEIQIAKSLDHPRILKFVSAWINKEKEEVVFITERITGGSLRAYIGRLDGPLKLKVVRNWCKQLLEGISYLHGQPNPVIHRDLKCDNIFVNGNDGKVIIGDLGLSTSLHGGVSCATSIVGTPEFMAPELYEEKYGPPVDIYAFGMCLLEMVARKYPYSECTTPGQIYKKVINNEKPKALSQIKDDALRHIIEVCLETDPNNRPTANELLGDPYWNQSDDGDKLAEIAEEPESEEDEGVVQDPQPTVIPRSGVYHEEAEQRRLQAAAAAASRPVEASPPPHLVGQVTEDPMTPTITTIRLPSNVVAGPTDDTLIFLSSPKSGVDRMHVDNCDVLTYCRRNKIERVEKVHLILEIEESKYHNVIFDFNALTDHPQIIAQELRDAGLVWSGVSHLELIMSIAKSIMDRIGELDTSVAPSVVGSANGVASGIGSGDVPLAPAPTTGTASAHIISSEASSIDLLSGDSPKTNSIPDEPSTTELTDAPLSRLTSVRPTVVDQNLVLQSSLPLSPKMLDFVSDDSVAPSTTAGQVPDMPAVSSTGSPGVSGKPPLAPRGSLSLDSIASSPNVVSVMKKNPSYYGLIETDSTYIRLSRESCSHLTVPCGTIELSGMRMASFDAVPSGATSVAETVSSSSGIPVHRRNGSVGGASDPGQPQAAIMAATVPVRRQSSMGSFDEHLASSLSSGGIVGLLPPSVNLPLNTQGRQITAEDVKQLQNMLAIISSGGRGCLNFVPGVYCAFTEDTVRDFQMHHGIEITGEVDDKTWEALADQVAYKKKKEEERAHKREEAQRKAKLEQEKRLQQQKEESARAMDNMLEKTLSLIGGSSTVPQVGGSKKNIVVSIPQSPTGTSTAPASGIASMHASPQIMPVPIPVSKSRSPRSAVMPPVQGQQQSAAPVATLLSSAPDGVVQQGGGDGIHHHHPPVIRPSSPNSPKII